MTHSLPFKIVKWYIILLHNFQVISLIKISNNNIPSESHIEFFFFLVLANFHFLIKKEGINMHIVFQKVLKGNGRIYIFFRRYIN